MNIYKYIRSKDVREYNEKIGHKFTATESAFLVWLNYEITLKEKHDAWHEIMREMPDETVPKRSANYEASLFTLLKNSSKRITPLSIIFTKKTNRPFILIVIFVKAILRSIGVILTTSIPTSDIYRGNFGSTTISISSA